MLLPLLLLLLPQDPLFQSSAGIQGRVFLMRSPSSVARSGYFPDLRSALTVAEDGDTLILEPGLYTGSGNKDLVVTQDVAIRGRYGAPGSVIDCEGAGRAFDFRVTQAMVEGLTIRGGQATEGGGARVSGGTVLFQEVTFESNSAQYGGGLASCVPASVILSRCRFLGNSASFDGGGISLGTGTCAGGAATVAECFLEGNAARFGGGLYVAGDFFSPIRVTGTTFERNFAEGGGAVALIFLGSLSLDQCTFAANEAQSSGGALQLGGLFEITYITNCLIVDNKAGSGPGGIGGISRVGITNCTVVGNESLSSRPGGIQTGVSSKPSAVLNCVIRDNKSSASSILDQQIQHSGNMFNPPDLTLLFSNVEGLVGSPTNIDLDPQFVDPTSGDYHILPSSPCVDAGLGFSLTLQQLDIDGEPRFQGLSVDIGCDEVPVASLGGS